jgi:predicted TIM-barrel fold metal-dependent hydrolase
MDEEGIDVAALLPTFAAALLSIDTMEGELAWAFAQAYNRWLRDFCSVAPQRLRGVGLISRHTPERMVADLEQIAAFGWTTVVLRPNPLKGRLLSDPAYEPFWSACEQLAINVVLHEGTHTRLPAAGADRFTTHFALHACSHPMEQMMALLALIEGGVLERHPQLYFAFLEAGAGWLPYWLWRLDEFEYRQVGGEVCEHVRLKPSEYFRRQCFVGIEPGEPHLLATLQWAGEGNVIFGTDFPHFDRDEAIVGQALKLQETWPARTLGKLLWDNAACFYKF